MRLEGSSKLPAHMLRAGGLWFRTKTESGVGSFFCLEKLQEVVRGGTPETNTPIQ